MKVNFLVVGTQKGGTTALQHFLADHPEIGWGRRSYGNPKEVHFFDEDRHFAGPTVDYAHYHAHFPDAEGKLAVGEATPIYMYWPNVPERIHAYSPTMKLVFLLRDPVERAFSHYKMLAVRGREPRSFGAAIREEQALRAAGRYVPHRMRSYVDRGFYVGQIERMRALFPREQMLFLRSEDLKRRHTETLDRVCRFLGAREIHHDRPETVFATPALEMADADRRFLAALYRPELVRLEALLGWDLSAWKSGARAAGPRDAMDVGIAP